MSNVLGARLDAFIVLGGPLSKVEAACNSDIAEARLGVASYSKTVKRGSNAVAGEGGTEG